MRHRAGRWAVLAAALGCAVSACALGADAALGSRAPGTPADRLYVSIGDSYAAGYQPTGSSAGATSTNGFAYQLVARAAAAGTTVRLVNFGCSGVTSTALLVDRGCDPGALGPGAADYRDASQAAAAEQFLDENRRHIELVTVIVGGNDMKPCIQTSTGAVRPDALACATGAVATLRTNLATLLQGVRAAVGPGVRVVGLTYPDPYLGGWTSDSPDSRLLATGSVSLFRDTLNPALRATYSAAGAAFVDVTAAAGAYGSLTDDVTDPTYGVVPAPVARACALTFYCRYGDVHPTTAGYGLIADQVLTTLSAA